MGRVSRADFLFLPAPPRPGQRERRGACCRRRCSGRTWSRCCCGCSRSTRSTCAWRCCRTWRPTWSTSRRSSCGRSSCRRSEAGGGEARGPSRGGRGVRIRAGVPGPRLVAGPPVSIPLTAERRRGSCALLRGRGRAPSGAATMRPQGTGAAASVVFSLFTSLAGASAASAPGPQFVLASVTDVTRDRKRCRLERET